MATKTSSVVAGLAVVFCFACGSSVPPPHDQYAAAEADVGRAQAGGAPGVPDAKLHLELAIEDLRMSKQLMDHDNARSTLLTAVASTEAQLALSLSRQAAARDQAHMAVTELQKGGVPVGAPVQAPVAPPGQ